MKINAYAKINWTLNITGQREDGYHLMDMLMQSIDLHDEITLILQEESAITLQVDGADLASNEQNLVYRAALLLQTIYNVEQGVDMHLCKRIPMGAGLGGGSADAAAVIHGLCELWQLDLSFDEKASLGLKLGADVPYCLFGKPARVQGIGEAITPISCDRSYPLVLLQPCEALSTKEAFHHFDAQPCPLLADNEAAAQALANGNAVQLSQACKNVMQDASELLRPAMKDALDDLKRQGAFLGQMTGSGSVVFGAFETEEEAIRCYDTLKQKYGVCHLSRTLMHV